MAFPKQIEKVHVPPIKCQGIKTKLVKFIGESIHWDGNGRWIEPFLGSGVVAFNMNHPRALLSDTNIHIIQLYQDIQHGVMTGQTVREALEEMGAILLTRGIDYYYEVRTEFNQDGGSMRFLFLNRSCFNGMMRFNSSGGYNVPFGHKPNRFAKAYITKIVNQVNRVSDIMSDKDWEFRAADWKDVLMEVNDEDFAYLDPPYIGRHTDYFNSWKDKDAIDLAQTANDLPCQFALSMWMENQYRKNDHIEDYWNGNRVITHEHFYHLGATENLRNSMTEALVMRHAV